MTCTEYIIGVKLCHSPISLYCVYVPINKHSLLRRQVSAEIVDLLSKRKNNTIIAGDFNSHVFPLGGNECSNGRRLFAAINDNGWSFINNPRTPTYIGKNGSSYIDWTIVSDNLVRDSTWKTIHDSHETSDHVLIVSTIGRTSCPRTSVPDPQLRKIIDLDIFLNAVCCLSAPQDLPAALSKIYKAATDALKPTVKTAIKWSPAFHRSKRLINSAIRLRDRENDPSRLMLLQARLTSLNAAHKHIVAEDKAKHFLRSIDDKSPSTLFKSLKKIINSEKVKVDTILVNDRLVTDTREIAERVLTHFFPMDSPSADMMQYLTENFTLTPLMDHEIDQAFDDQLVDTPGIDMINTIVLKAWYKRDPRFLRALIRFWFERGDFPHDLCQTMIVLLKKALNLDNTLENLRPIGLCTVLSKIYERIILRRLEHHLFTNNLRSIHQYAYRRDLTINDAIAHIQRTREHNFDHGIPETLVSLDVKGAFNEVRHDAILNHLVECRVPAGLVNIVTHYLSNRTVTLAIDGSGYRRRMFRGVTQGSVLGPVLFTATLDHVLHGLDRIIRDNNIVARVITYADDINIILSAYPSSDIRNLQLKLLLEGSSALLGTIGLRLSFPKIQLMESSRNLFSDFTLKLGSKCGHENITSQSYCKILGIVFQYNGLFDIHLKHIRGKAYAKFSRVFRVISSRKVSNLETAETVTRSSIYPTFTYGAHVWFKQTTGTFINGIRSIDRAMIRAAARLPPNFSNASALALRRQTPLVVELKRMKMILEAKTDASLGVEYRYPLFLAPHPACLNPVNVRTDPFLGTPCDLAPFAHNVFTDASKQTDTKMNVGCAFVVTDTTGRRLYTRRFALPPHATVYQGEIYTIYCAMRHCSEHLNGSVQIITDCLSAVRSIGGRRTNDPILNIIWKIALKSMDTTVFTLSWCKGHSGVEGNELADKLAKTACSKKAVIAMHKSLKVYKTELNRTALEDWSQLYQALPPASHAKQFFPTLDHPMRNYVTLNKTNVRFYSGNGPFLVSAAVLNPAIPTNCFCEASVQQDVKHVLIECTDIIAENLLHFKSSGLSRLVADNQPWSKIATSKEVHDYITWAGDSILSTLEERNHKVLRTDRLLAFTSTARKRRLNGLKILRAELAKLNDPPPKKPRNA